MKKILSIVLSLVMLLSVSAFTVSAFAENVGSIESTTSAPKIITEVNGKVADDVVYTQDPENPKKFTFTYTGDGELVGWEFPGMVLGTDYQIISEDGNSITILVSDDYKGDVVANAIVKFDDEEEEESEKETSKKSSVSTTARRSTSSKSPKTGAASAAGLVAMGAGAAILTALKKKEDAE